MCIRDRDIDALAVKTAVENAEINHVADKFTAIAGNLTEQINGKYHIVLANIVADVIMVLTEDIEQYLSLIHISLPAKMP